MSKPNVKEMKAKKDVKGLLEVLKHSRIIGTSINDSFGALDMIVEIGADAVEPLIEALDSDKDEVVRWVSANALGRIGDKKALEPLIEALKNDVNPDVRWHAAESLGELGEGKAVEPLTNALKDKDDWVRNFAASALKKIREALGLVREERTMPRAEPEVPAKVPLRVKPASERTRQLPNLSSFDELRTFLERAFTPTEYKPKYDWMRLDYWMTPEELCDIVEKYADLIEVQFSEYPCPISEDFCCVMLFQKNPPEGSPIELNGFCAFASADYAIPYLQNEYGRDLAYVKILPKLAGIQGKYQLNFGRGYENPRDATYKKDKGIPPHNLWNRIYARRKRLGIPEPVLVGTTEPATKEPEIPALTALVEDIVAGLRCKTSSRLFCYAVLFGDRPLTAKMGGDESIMIFSNEEKANAFISGYQRYYLTTKPLSTLALGTVNDLWSLLNNPAKDPLYRTPYGLIINFSYGAGTPYNVYSIQKIQSIGKEGIEKGLRVVLIPSRGDIPHNIWNTVSKTDVVRLLLEHSPKGTAGVARFEIDEGPVAAIVVHEDLEHVLALPEEPTVRTRMGVIDCDAAVVLVMLALVEGKYYETWWNFYSPGQLFFQDMARQDRFMLAFVVDDPEPSRVIWFPNNYKSAFAETIEKMKSREPWTMAEFDEAKDALCRRFPSVQALWESLSDAGV